MILLGAVGQEGRGTLWVVHAGIPLTVSVEQCRHATGNEMLAKRVLELRPSKKRRRQELEDEAGQDDDRDDEIPLPGDLVGVGGPPGHQQPGYTRLLEQDAEQETQEPQLPPGLLQPPATELPTIPEPNTQHGDDCR